MKTINIVLIGDRKIITIYEKNKIIKKEVYVKNKEGVWCLEEKQKQKEN